MPCNTKQRNTIESAFRSIPDVYSGFSLVSDVIRSAALKGEKHHRRGRTGNKFPATLAAKYFTVKWLAGYASGRDAMPEIRDIHRLRKDCILAASFAADYPSEFGEWARAIPAEFWNLDYAEFMGD